MENFDKSENDFEGDGKLQCMPKSSISNFEAIAIEAAVADGLISSNAALKLNGDLKNKKAGLRFFAAGCLSKIACRPFCPNEKS
jgi:hypothetical protein